ncbi:MAG: DUF1292 domain-containing protein [Eubacterium sp.]|nr:DUF1292 domain-containing protein [Eubacterium sp.]
MTEGMITLTDEDGSDLEFYILEQTELGGETYLLVTDSAEDEEEAEALILREIVTEDGEAVYESVEDETTLEALSKLFEELLEDVDILM